jgi:uncharacterized Tic20 family protein
MDAMPNYWDNPTAPPPGPQHPLEDAQTSEFERTYSMFEHLTLLVHIPIFLALILWLIKRDRSPFVDDHGREAVNFQISLVIYYLIGIATTVFCGVGAAVIVATYILGIVGMILAAIAANKGRYYRYPACIRLLH